jgi:hypothetical protein
MVPLVRGVSYQGHFSAAVADSLSSFRCIKKTAQLTVHAVAIVIPYL